MSNIDQFESVFKSAAKAVYQFKKITFPKILVLTDLNESEVVVFEEKTRKFLQVLKEATQWKIVSGDSFREVGGLLEFVKKESPDLICTYRNLHTTAWKWPYSLGTYLDVLAQVVPVPVLVFPHPKADSALDQSVKDPQVVMAMTDHLVGDHSLVNNAVHFTKENGTLFLTNVEDRPTFDRYIESISKIPDIDTDTAREEIAKQLLKDARDYIQSCRKGLKEEKIPIEIDELVTMGTHLIEYKNLIQDKKVDLLVLHTKDHDQFAMHGLAYTLAVELREIPLLMI